MYVYMHEYVCVYIYIYIYIYIYMGETLRLRMPVIYWSTLSHSHATESFTYIHRPQTPKLYQLINKDKI